MVAGSFCCDSKAFLDENSHNDSGWTLAKHESGRGYYKQAKQAETCPKAGGGTD